MSDKLGAFIKVTRKHRRWSLRDLANRCGTSFSTISRIENGEDCQLSALIEIASAFNMEVGDLLIAAGFTNGDVTRVAVISIAHQAIEIGLRELGNRNDS